MGDRELEQMADVERLVRRALALRQELNEPAAPFDVALDDDPARALFQLAAVAPLGPADQQRLLAVEAPGPFLSLLAELTGDEIGFLAQRLAGN
jgi:Lon protease-like protein